MPQPVDNFVETPRDIIVRFYYALFLMILFISSARADSYRGYLKIDCEPSIGHFSVRPTGTWYFDAIPPDGFVPLDFGQSYSTISSTWIKEKDSDIFAVCEMPEYLISKNQKGLTFKVERSNAYEPANCGGCAHWRADFIVTLNGKKLTSGLVGRHDMRSMDNIKFDGEDIQICQSLPANGYMTPNADGRYQITCEIKSIRDFLATE